MNPTEARMTRMGDNKDRPRWAQPTVGFFNEPPTVGRPFRFFGPSLTSKDGVRVIDTTPVKMLSFDNGVYLFCTHTSSYKVELLKGK